MSAIDIIRWVLAGLLAGTWLLIAGGHVLSLIGAAIRKGSTSFIPVIGGVAGALSLLVCPLPGSSYWAWLPPILDLGCIPMLIAMAYLSATQRRSPKPDDPR
jgi:hypothetical protein